MNEQYQPGKIACLAQALDEAIPAGATGVDAAKAVADFLDERGWVIQPKTWRCDTCGRTFDSFEAKRRHRLDKHTPHLKLSAKDRPANLGDVPCGLCEQTFANEWNARQHRRAVHGTAHEQSPGGENG